MATSKRKNPMPSLPLKKGRKSAYKRRGSAEPVRVKAYVRNPPKKK